MVYTLIGNGKLEEKGISVSESIVYLILLLIKKTKRKRKPSWKQWYALNVLVMLGK